MAYETYRILYIIIANYFSSIYNDDVTYFQSIILSIVEGLTEFLPVSSTGHLILVSEFLGAGQSEFLKSFEIIIQLGAILAVIVLYRNSFLRSYMAWKRILVAFLPTGIIGFLLYKFIKDFLLGNAIITVFALLIGGILLILIEYLLKNKKIKTREIENISYKNSFLIGVFQSISIIPGVSRAASSIIGGLILGLDRETAVLFSFLLAVPTIFAATAYEFTKSSITFSPYEYSLLAVGFICSFIVAILSIKFLMSFVKKHTFIPFGIYRIAAGLLYWLVILR